MRSPLLAAALLLGCALQAVAEPHEVFSVPDAPALQAPPATHRIPVQFVILRGSRWTWAVVEQRVTKTKEVLAQCGVRLDTTISELVPPGPNATAIYDTKRSHEPTGMSTIVSALSQPKPTVFYVDGFPDNAAQGGTARPQHTAAGQVVPEVDTAWIPYFETPPPAHANYSVDAHELVHVLADIAHWSPPYQSPPGHAKGDFDPNKPEAGLMVRMPEIRTNILHPYICERIKKFPRATPL